MWVWHLYPDTVGTPVEASLTAWQLEPRRRDGKVLSFVVVVVVVVVVNNYTVVLLKLPRTVHRSIKI